MKPSKDEIEFLKESNYIEREYSKKAFYDAKKAWNYAIENKDNFSLHYILGIHRNLMQRLNPKIAGDLERMPFILGEKGKKSQNRVN